MVTEAANESLGLVADIFIGKECPDQVSGDRRTECFDRQFKIVDPHLSPLIKMFDEHGALSDEHLIKGLLDRSRVLIRP